MIERAPVEVTLADIELVAKVWYYAFADGSVDEHIQAAAQLVARHRIAAVADDTWKAIR